MTEATAAPLQVMHLMRTYGAHGGEQQLSQYFGCEPRGRVRETFVFVYRDPECSALFSGRAPDLEQIALRAQPVATATAWRELAALLPSLPLLQWRFLRLALHRRPDVCVVHGFQGALVAWPAAMLSRRTRWVYVHRITKSATGSNMLFRLIYRPYACVAGNSRAVTASLAPLARADRLATLDNGLDWHRFEARAQVLLKPLPPASGRILVCVGRLLPHKGQRLLIDAFERIAADYPDTRLWVVGDGPEMGALSQCAGASRFAARIALLGRREDVPAVLAQAAIFVNASAWEGMSNAVLEGMAAGLPAVVADAPGVTECHVNGVTGLVVRRDSAAIAEALAALLDNAELCRRMGEAGRARLRETYSMEASRRRYLELFGKLTGRQACAAS